MEAERGPRGAGPDRAGQVDLPPAVETALAGWAEAAVCRLLIVFGSVASSRAHSGSDVDLALLFEVLPSPQRRLRLIGELQELCGGSPVDVVFLHPGTDPTLRFEIFRSGRPLYEAATGVFADEASRAVSLYEDALPFRRMLRDQLRRQAGMT